MFKKEKKDSNRPADPEMTENEENMDLQEALADDENNDEREAYEQEAGYGNNEEESRRQTSRSKRFSDEDFDGVTLEDLMREDDPDFEDEEEEEGRFQSRLGQLKDVMNSPYKAYAIIIGILFVFFLAISTLRDMDILNWWQELLIQAAVIIIILIIWLRERRK